MSACECLRCLYVFGWCCELCFWMHLVHIYIDNGLEQVHSTSHYYRDGNCFLRCGKDPIQDSIPNTPETIQNLARGFGNPWQRCFASTPTQHSLRAKSQYLPKFAQTPVTSAGHAVPSRVASSYKPSSKAELVAMAPSRIAINDRSKFVTMFYVWLRKLWEMSWGNWACTFPLGSENEFTFHYTIWMFYKVRCGLFAGCGLEHLIMQGWNVTVFMSRKFQDIYIEIQELSKDLPTLFGPHQHL